MAAVVEGQIGQGHAAAAARNEEVELGAIALFRGIVLALLPDRPAQELGHGIQRTRQPDAVDRTAHRPVGFLHPARSSTNDEARGNCRGPREF